MLVKMDYPLATGIIRSVEEPTFGERERALVETVSESERFKNVDDLFFAGETYEVK